MFKLLSPNFLWNNLVSNRDKAYIKNHPFGALLVICALLGFARAYLVSSELNKNSVLSFFDSDITFAMTLFLLICVLPSLLFIERRGFELCQKQKKSRLHRFINKNRFWLIFVPLITFYLSYFLVNSSHKSTLQLPLIFIGIFLFVMVVNFDVKKNNRFTRAAHLLLFVNAVAILCPIYFSLLFYSLNLAQVRVLYEMLFLVITLSLLIELTFLNPEKNLPLVVKSGVCCLHAFTTFHTFALCTMF